MRLSSGGRELRYGEAGGSPQHLPGLRLSPSLLLGGTVTGIDTSLGTENSLQPPMEIHVKCLRMENPVVLQKVDKSVLEEECRATLAGVPMPST